MLVAATHEDVDNVAWRVRRMCEHVQDDRFVVALGEFLFAPGGRVLVCPGGCSYHSVLVVGEGECGFLWRALV